METAGFFYQPLWISLNMLVNTRERQKTKFKKKMETIQNYAIEQIHSESVDV